MHDVTVLLFWSFAFTSVLHPEIQKIVFPPPKAPLLLSPPLFEVQFLPNHVCIMFFSLWLVLING